MRSSGAAGARFMHILSTGKRGMCCLRRISLVTSEAVIDWLTELLAMRGVPRCIRSDNGPEFIARAIRAWLAQVGVETLYVEPGSPWQNGYAESFHSRLRDEFLAMEEFESLAAARKLTVCRTAHWDTPPRPCSPLAGLLPLRSRLRLRLSQLLRSSNPANFP